MSRADMTWSCNASDAFNLETLTREAPTTRVNLIGPRGDNAPAVEVMTLREAVTGRASAAGQIEGSVMKSMNDMTTQQKRARVAELQNERTGHVSRRDWDAVARIDAELDPLRAILRMNDNPAVFTLHRW